MRWAAGSQPRFENQLPAKHVETIWVPCLDEGSTPSSSTNLLKNSASWRYFNFNPITLKILPLINYMQMPALLQATSIQP